MSDILKSRRFRLEREADWKRLEDLLNRFEKGRGSGLTDDEVIAIPVLYRATLSSLSMARAISLDQSLVSYLEGLSTRAYFCVYGARTTVIERLARFFAQDWRDAVQALWAETIVSAVTTALGVVVAYILVRQSPSWYGTFVPEELAAGRNPGASTQALYQTLHGHHVDGLSIMATSLFTHNAQVALVAFALGFACCLPTAFLMVYQGLMLGAFLALFFSHGLGFEFGGWVLIHGTTELFAVTLAGAAGFHIGWSLAFPGAQSRMDALVSAGRRAAVVMAGVVVMLAVAGVLEGFARQLVEVTWLRYAIALGMLTAWCVYFYAPLREEE